MSLKDIARLAILINNIRLTTVQNIELTSTSGKVKVDTLEGLAGAAIGSGEVSVTFSCYVPAGGQEVDFFSLSTQESGYVDIQIPVGSDTYRGTGWLVDTKIGQTTGQETKVDVSWTGESNEMQ